MKYSIIEELRALAAMVNSTDPTKDRFDLSAYQQWVDRVFDAHERLQDALPNLLDLLEEGAVIIEHLRKNIPRGWIVDWEDRINAFLDKLKKEKETA